MLGIFRRKLAGSVARKSALSTTRQSDSVSVKSQPVRLTLPTEVAPRGPEEPTLVPLMKKVTEDTKLDRGDPDIRLKA